MATLRTTNNNVDISKEVISPGDTGRETIQINQKEGEEVKLTLEFSLSPGEIAFVKGVDGSDVKMKGLPLNKTYQNFSNTPETYFLDFTVPSLPESDLGNSRFLEIVIPGDGSNNNNNTNPGRGAGGGTITIGEDTIGTIGDNDSSDGSITISQPTFDPG